MKIGLITFHSSKNYGAVLQCYALQTVLSLLGHDVQVIDRRWGKLGNMAIPKVYRLISKIKNIVNPEPFSQFRDKYLNLTKEIKSELQLRDVANSFDVLLVGSDQVWNFDCINVMDYYYYLNWCSDVIKYSYAASFGRDTFDVPDVFKKIVAKAFRQFSGISVREDSGVKICLEMMGVVAKQHIDPTLLLDSHFYIRSMKLSKKVQQDKSICMYFLDKSEDKMFLASMVAKEKDSKIINNLPEYTGMGRYLRRQLTVEQWISNIASSEYVVTDSYHGMIFAIIFEKPFIVYNNKERGPARFESLLKLLGLEDRIIQKSEDFKFSRACEINYDKINHILRVERERAVSYLEGIKQNFT